MGSLRIDQGFLPTRCCIFSGEISQRQASPSNTESMDGRVGISRRRGLRQAASKTEYDYIICGGGTAGLAVANRLTENSNITVLVVEAGINGTTDGWDYKSTPQEYSNGRVLDLPAGKTVGGSSQINGKVYSRPDSSSIDDWGRVNDADWSWNTLLPFYKASESFSIPSDDQQAGGNTYNVEYHGFSGPLNVSFPAVANPELTRQNDFNGGDARGLSTYPAQFVIEGEREQIRESSREAYYLPAASRSNLELLDETSCLRITWVDNTTSSNNTITATGVEIANTNSLTTIHATKEIILSAGAYRSPGILEFSGVGSAALLANYSIDSINDLPGVGENLQDQMQGSIAFQKSNESNITFPATVGDDITTNYLMHLTYEDVFGDDAGDVQGRVNASLAEYASTIEGAINGSLSAEQILRSLEVQYNSIFVTGVPVVELFTGQALGNDAINLEFWPLIPLGRGNVHISGGNPQAASHAPTINNNWGLLDIDWELYTAAGRYVRRFFATSPLSTSVLQETSPGLDNLPADASDEQWRDYWADNFRAGWHPVGSCAMLPREWGGVVDGDLRVHGTGNVRVVDASVIPFQLGGHPTSTVYALAERAAVLILKGVRG
ncbi:GMC oxidoreductase [Zasmidium cellare ATCC 36951]|uniref:GMC oxidoreductase n=1 Tax=Zasmidium cellare ATCC 36951 TaxID=1080233 RepID=A0A6A6CYK9_ZASCE|nr:GMC oxidoreductase [Zasmidium cellare ATCC 36951]KAF2171280.1 GMC oxidoreductase [Zasmidium cellare ATCC 36951]